MNDFMHQGAAARCDIHNQSVVLARIEAKRGRWLTASNSKRLGAIALLAFEQPNIEDAVRIPWEEVALEPCRGPADGARGPRAHGFLSSIANDRKWHLQHHGQATGIA